MGLEAWKDVAGVLRLLQFVVFPRRGFKIKTDLPGVVKMNIPKKDISSTKIRRLARKGSSLGRFIPKEVCSYIEKKNLYHFEKISIRS